MSHPAPISHTPSRNTVSDDTLNGQLGYVLKRAFNVFQARLVQVLKPHELRMLTYTALVLIADNPGLRQSQLAEVMEIERPNLVVIIDELEQNGLITRERVPTDRRAYALIPTLAGKQRADAATRAIRSMETELLADLSTGEQEHLASILGVIRNKGR